MKVVCDGCQAKYKLTDGRLAGRTLKFRCRKCGNTIVLDGAEFRPAFGAPGAPGAFGVGAFGALGHGSPDPRFGRMADDAFAQDVGAPFETAGEWYLSINGEPYGPCTTEQMSSLLCDGQVPWDTYVWREGYGDWKAASESKTLVAAAEALIAASAADAGFHDAFAEAGNPASADQALGGQSYDDQDWSASSSPNQPSPGSYPDVSAFSRSATAPGAISRAHEDPRRPRSDADTGFGEAEMSGLIDIRALAALAGTGRNSSSGVSASDAAAYGSEDRLSFTSPGERAAGHPDTLAPVVRGGRQRNKAVPFAILSGSALIAAASFVAIYSSSAATKETPSMVAAIPDDAPIGTLSESEGEAPTELAGTTLAPAAGDPVGSGSGSERNGALDAAATKASSGSADGAQRAKSSGLMASKPSASSRAELERDIAAAAAKDDPALKGTVNPYRQGEGAREASAKAGPGGADRSLDDLLNDAIPGDAQLEKALASSAVARAPSRSGSEVAGLPDTPSRDQVVAAMRAIDPDVRACLQGQALEANTAAAAFTVAGSTGRVDNVRISGISGAVNACIARAVRNAMFPQFAKAHLRINFPFRLGP